MFLPTVHSVTSLRQPYFAGKGDQERPTGDNQTGTPKKTEDKGDTWRPRRGTASSVQSTTSALTQMMKGLLPGQASEASEADQALEAPVESGPSASKSGSNPKGKNQPSSEQQAGSRASSSEQGKTAMPKRMQALLGTSKTPSPIVYKQNILATSTEGRQRRFSDVASEASGKQRATETDLPVRSHFSTSPHTSLMVDVSDTRSAAPSRHPAFSVGKSPSVSDDAGSNLSESSNSEGSSAWLVDDDSDVLAEREARKTLARSQKGTDKASSAAPSVILEEPDEEDGDSHYLDGDSQLDDDDYFLYDADGDSHEGSDTEGKSFVSAAPSRARDIGGASSRVNPKKEDDFAKSLLRVRSQEEVQASMNLPRESLLSRVLQSPEDRKLSDLVLSYRQNIEQERAILNRTLSQQQIKMEKEAVIQLCNRFTLEELENGQKNFTEGLRRNDRRLEDLAQRVGVPQGVSLPEALHRHQEKLKAQQIELTVQLEQLPHPGLGAKVSVSHIKKERDALNQTREAALDAESQVESALQRYEALKMDEDRLQLKLSQTNQAIFLKKRRDMVKQLNECPPDQDSKIKLWNELARTYTVDELGAMMNFLNKKKAPEVQLGILKKAIDIKTIK